MIANKQPAKFEIEDEMFHTGMTLDQYLTKIQSQPKSVVNQFPPESENDENLYETSHNKQLEKYSSKIITYLIKETDQDNYDQSGEIIAEKRGAGESRQRLQNLRENCQPNIIGGSFKTVEQINQKDKNTNFRVRQQSNSPYKQVIKQVHNFSPNKIFSQTLHQNNNWRIHHQDQQSHGSPFLPFSSTIYQKSPKMSKLVHTQTGNQQMTNSNKLNMDAHQICGINLHKKSANLGSTSQTNLTHLTSLLSNETSSQQLTNMSMLMMAKNSKNKNNNHYDINNNLINSDKNKINTNINTNTNYKQQKQGKDKFTQFQLKNRMEIQHINKYQKQLLDKYDKVFPQIMGSIRVQGIKDRLLDKNQYKNNNNNRDNRDKYSNKVQKHDKDKQKQDKARSSKHGYRVHNK